MAPYTSSYYNKLYRQVYASPSWTRRLRDLPWIHMFDDHEIINDWAPSHPDKTLYPDAIQPFEHYQLSVNPPAAGHSGTMYTAFNIGQVAFFVLDNRSYRSQQPDRPGQGSTAGFGARTMLGLDQLLRLKRWIEQEGGSNGRLLVLVSGVPFTRNWSKGKDEFDSWAVSRHIFALWLTLTTRATSMSGKRSWSFSGRKEEPSSSPGTAMSMVRMNVTAVLTIATTLLPPPPNSSHPRNSAVIEFSTSPLSFFHQPWKREYEAHLPTDVPIHVQWEGMSRFGRFDFDTSVGLAVNYTLVVDGEEAWSYTWHKGMDVNSSTSFA
jgi:alkaline phosphatase D